MEKFKKFNVLSVLVLSLTMLGCSGNSILKRAGYSSGATNTIVQDLGIVGEGSGATVFSNPAELNVVAKGASEYRVGPSDLIDIKVFKVEELSRSVRVDDRGVISMPLLGNVVVGGLTQVGIEQKLAQLLGAKYLQNPQVSVFIKEFTTRRFTVGGAVNRPGVFPIQGNMTFLQAIATAGGLKQLGDTRKVVLFRKQNGQVRAYNLDLASVRTGALPDPYLTNEDHIVVHESTSKKWIENVKSLLRFSPITVF